jgi:hypothetical protein
MKKLDDVSWHLDSEEFYAGLPEENAATHIGFFVAWAINNGLWGAIPGTDCPAAVQRVQERAITGRVFVLEECDGKLFPTMFNAEGCAFANKYSPRTYIKDYYNALVVGLASGYLVADSWDNCERMAEVIEQRYVESKAKPWWKVW